MPSNKKQLDRTPQQQQMIDCIPVLRHPQEPWPGYWKEIADAAIAERDGLAARLAEDKAVWEIANRTHTALQAENNELRCKLAAVLREEE